MKNLPEKIYLQIDADGETPEDFKELGGVSWADERIHKNDVEYILAAQFKQTKPAEDLTLEQAFDNFWNYGYAFHDLSTSDPDFDDLDYEVVRKIFEAGAKFKEAKQGENLTLEQAANKWSLDNADDTMATNSTLNRGFIAGAKWQSQQPLSVEWLTDDDFDRMFSDAIPDNVLRKQGAKQLQSELKKRVNAVDPVELLRHAKNNPSIFASSSPEEFYKPLKPNQNERRKENSN